MRRFTTFLAILILLSSAAPLLACMTDAAMTREESACCKSMQGHCGDMVKMGCCRTEVHTDSHPQLATVAPAIDFPLAVVDVVQPLVAPVQTVPPSLLRIPDDHSPPGLVTARRIVLRI